MKKLILAGLLIAAGATTASAEFRPYNGGYRFVDTRHRQLCEERAERVRDLEHQLHELREHGRDGDRIVHRIRELRYINATSCGPGRWPYWR